MLLSQQRTLLRRHWIAACVVIILAMGMAWDVKATPATYKEGAKVVFLTPGHANPYSALGPELIPMANLIATTMSSTEYLGKIRAAGGTATTNIAMVNLHNEQFPVYGVPYITVATASAEPSAASRTFSIVIGMLRNLAATWQTQAGAPWWSLVSVRVVADTGVQSSKGSSIRALTGLILLTMLLVFMAVTFLDRRPWLRGMLASLPRSANP